MADLKIGQTIETADGRQGIIRYIGDIHVAAGQFLGIELPTANGKNDGSVKGERYFDCPPEHGLFVRPSGIARVVSMPVPAPAPPKAAAPRPSLAKPPSTIKTALRPTSLSKAPLKAPATAPATANRLSIATPGLQAASKAPVRQTSISTSSTSSTVNRYSRPSISTAKPTQSPPITSAPLKPSKDSQSKSRDPAIDTLETKLRHVEKQYAEAKDRLKEFDRVQSERNRFEGLIQKLQAKCQSFHQDITELKATLKRDEAELERLSKNEQEQESIMELATLDREMAEERAEQAEAEVELLRQRLEEKELELDILHSEADLITDDMSDEAKQAAGYYRLQNENDRLKEALLRLKEITEETEADLKSRVRELEADQAQNERLRDSQRILEATIANQEAIIEDLRQQVDASNAWEDIIEDLSDQNTQIKDKLAEKEGVIRDLVSLKELNDELEVHHIEQAKDLRAELEAKEDELEQVTQKITEQDAAIAGQELLITKFRDLVLDLQAKMTDVESSKIMSDEQAKDVTGRFHEVMELNRRLHNANISTTVKTIAAELQKLQAEEANEELQIVKHYLGNSPDIYQNESLPAYFRAKRISFKSDLSRTLLKTANVLSGTTEDMDRFLNELFRHDAIQQLTQLGLKSTRLYSAVSTSTMEQFAAFSVAYDDLAPVEKSIENCLDSLKADDLHYKETSATLRRSDLILRDIATKFSDILADRPENEMIFRVSSIKSNFELIKAGFDTAKLCIEEVGISDGEWEHGSQHILGRLSMPSTEAAKSILAADKLIHVLEALRQDSLRPNYPDGIEDMISQDEFVAHAARAVHNFATDLCDFVISQESGEANPVPASVISKALSTIEELHFGNNELFKIGDVIGKLNYWNEYGSILMNNVEIEVGLPPWVQKSHQMEAEKIDFVKAEEKIHRLASEHRATMLQVRERDEIIEIKDLEIDHLKAKTREAAAYLEELMATKKELDKAQALYLEFKEHVGKEIEELRRLDAEDKEKARAAQSLGSPIGQAAAVPLEISAAPGKSAAKTASQSDTSLMFYEVVHALENENHWLRRRENAEMFGHNLRDMFTRIQNFQRAQARKELKQKQKKADQILAMSLSVEKAEIPPVPSYMIIPDTPPTKSTTLLDITNVANRSRSRTPVLLTPLKTNLSWTPNASTPAHHWAEMENYELPDLSPIANQFTAEEEDEWERFSEVGEVTLHTIIERAMWC